MRGWGLEHLLFIQFLRNPCHQQVKMLDWLWRLFASHESGFPAWLSWNKEPLTVTHFVKGEFLHVRATFLIFYSQDREWQKEQPKGAGGGCPLNHLSSKVLMIEFPTDLLTNALKNLKLHNGNRSHIDLSNHVSFISHFHTEILGFSI